MRKALKIVVLGLSITSSWGNGHATTYRSLLREMRRRGHDVLFLERDAPWYAQNRDMARPPFCRTALYGSISDLQRRFGGAVHEADAVIVGSYVPQGVDIGRWVTSVASGVTAFYDIDTPITLAKLSDGDFEYLSPELIPRFDLYLSFSGGPTLDVLEGRYRSPRAVPLYCSVDPEMYSPVQMDADWDLAYMGTYSADRQPTLERLLLSAARAWPAGRFAVAGPQYPPEVAWPQNVRRTQHLPPSEHRRFYARQRYTLNVTRDAMIRAGYSPSVRLFEAAACGAPIISDLWHGLGEFFEIGTEILVSESTDDTLSILRHLPESVRRSIGARGRERVLQRHTAARRAAELEAYLVGSAATDPAEREAPAAVGVRAASEG